MLQGLQNLGNTCSINTLIQCIGHSQKLREWFLSDQPHQIQIKQDHSGDTHQHQLYLSIELARIIHEMWNEHKSLAPSRFIKTIYQSLQGMISRGEQLDLSELWMLVVDKINSEIGKKVETPMIEGNSRDLNAFRNSWNNYNQQCMSSFLQMIQGWTVTRVQCSQCNDESRHFEPFCSLGLDVHEAQGSINTMFDTMFKKEQISSRTCDHCKACCDADKYTQICMYPNVLVIYFKRFEVTATGYTKKIADAIDIPLRIKFSGMENSYNLCSIGNHVGNLQGGHYYSIAKNPDDKWYIYDDISITYVEDISTILKKNRDGYMLVYEIN